MICTANLAPIQVTDKELCRFDYAHNARKFFRAGSRLEQHVSTISIVYRGIGACATWMPPKERAAKCLVLPKPA